MNQIILENLHPNTLDKLQTLAHSHNRSLEDEIKAILEQVTEVEITNKQVKFQQAWAKIDEARKHHSNRIFSDSAELLREDRNRD